MTYAQGRVINDADSHIMELPDFLTARAASPEILAGQIVYPQSIPCAAESCGTSG